MLYLGSIFALHKIKFDGEEWENKLLRYYFKTLTTNMYVDLKRQKFHKTVVCNRQFKFFSNSIMQLFQLLDGWNLKIHFRIKVYQLFYSLSGDCYDFLKPHALKS